MNRENLINLLLKIEQEESVDRWLYKDIQVWPLLKWNLFVTFSSVDCNKKRKGHIGSKVLRILILLFNSLLYNLKLAFTLHNKKDFLYFGYLAHRVMYKNKLINKYFYPLKKENESLYIEYGEKSELLYPNEYIDLKTASALYLLKHKFFRIKGVDFKQKLDKYFEDKQKLDEAHRHFFACLTSILAYSELTKKIIKRVSPQEVMVLCYYNTEVFGVCHAANSLGVLCTDVQHGGQGGLHPMYSFSDFPKEGYNTLPKQFWVWDMPSLKHIESWLSENNYHKVIKKGNPWIEFSVENIQYEFNENKRILYTLQQKYLDDYIIKAISLDETYEWWLRFHPRMKDAYDNIRKQLIENNILNKVNLVEANELPLPLLLKNSDFHLSKFSGSIIEAEQVGVKTIILESIGVKSYKEYIEWGNSIGIENPTAEEILKIIKKNDKKDNI